MNLTILLLAVLAHVVSTYTVHKIGQYHYHPSKSTKRTIDKVWDVCHKSLPDMHQLEFITTAFFIVPITLVLCSSSRSDIIKDIFVYFPLVMIIRAFMIFATILPRHKKCNSEKLTWESFFVGHCYDKIFSGHFALTLLMTLALHRYNTISTVSVVMLNLINAFLILMTRSHYTNDIVVAFFITFAIYNNCFVAKKICS